RVHFGRLRFLRVGVRHFPPTLRRGRARSITIDTVAGSESVDGPV
ncbi:MAG: hypothetical protein QOJ57_2306, partial [Thermoleophilaceae bacterium]|nr:hypothetical protein [Thermoleophilaceae bacterium]